MHESEIQEKTIEQIIQNDSQIEQKIYKRIKREKCLKLRKQPY